MGYRFGKFPGSAKRAATRMEKYGVMTAAEARRVRAERKYYAAQQRQQDAFLRSAEGQQWLRQQQAAQERQLEQQRLLREKQEQERKLKEQQLKEWQARIDEWQKTTAAGRWHKKQSDAAGSVGCAALILSMLTIIFFFLNVYIAIACLIPTVLIIAGWVHSSGKIPELPANLKRPQ